MTDAEQQEQTSPNDPTKVIQGVKTELDAKLAEVQEQLKAMNSQFAESLQSIASAIKPKETKPTQSVFTDEVVYDASKMEAAVRSAAKEIAGAELAREREMNTTIYNLSQEYPEITSDPQIQKAVREAQAALPASMKESALGIETAILKAVTKAGLMPKSKRQVVDDDISGSPSRGEGSRGTKEKKAKIDPKTLEFAQLLGRDINDPKVLKGLEEASQRESYSRYR